MGFEEDAMSEEELEGIGEEDVDLSELKNVGLDDGEIEELDKGGLSNAMLADLKKLGLTAEEMAQLSDPGADLPEVEGELGLSEDIRARLATKDVGVEELDALAEETGLSREELEDLA